MEKINIKIIMENGKEMEAELYPDVAPITVENFVKLIKENFFDGITFHRVIPGFMIQGGDTTGTGMGGSKDNIKGEFLANGFVNNLKHERGVLSMARTQDPNSASSQFFIMHDDAPYLDGQYAAFGSVIEGMDEVDKIVKTRVITRSPFGGGKDRPVEPPVMKKVTVDTFGVDYTEPNKL